MKLLIVLLFPVFCFADEYVGFVQSGVEKGYTVLVYQKSNGEVCKLKMRESQVGSNERTITEWFEYVNTIKCENGGTNEEPSPHGLDKVR